MRNKRMLFTFSIDSYFPSTRWLFRDDKRDIYTFSLYIVRIIAQYTVNFEKIVILLRYNQYCGVHLPIFVYFLGVYSTDIATEGWFVTHALARLKLLPHNTATDDRFIHFPFTFTCVCCREPVFPFSSFFSRLQTFLYTPHHNVCSVWQWFFPESRKKSHRIFLFMQQYAIFHRVHPPILHAN